MCDHLHKTGSIIVLKELNKFSNSNKSFMVLKELIVQISTEIIIPLILKLIQSIRNGNYGSTESITQLDSRDQQDLEELMNFIHLIE